MVSRLRSEERSGEDLRSAVVAEFDAGPADKGNKQDRDERTLTWRSAWSAPVTAPQWVALAT
jgi:hypothetical protein